MQYVIHWTRSKELLVSKRHHQVKRQTTKWKKTVVHIYSKGKYTNCTKETQMLMTGKGELRPQ